MTSTSQQWWSKDTVAVVTGANKGTGYKIARQLAQQGVTVALTARDHGRGQAAVDALKKEGLESVCFHQLDVLSSESVETLATWLKDKFGGFDILVNNAGVARGPNGIELEYEIAKAVLETNYYGVQKVTKGLMPLLQSSQPEGARIINNTSGLALYERLGSEKLKQIFRDEENYSEELIDSLATKYLEDVRAGRSQEEGWVEGKGPMYTESKIFMNAHSMALARSLTKSQLEENNTFLVIFGPGVTLTDMLRNTTSGPDKEIKPLGGFRLKTPEEAADTPVWLALMPREELTSKHWKIYVDRKEYPFSRKMKF
ncbi:unnamed protein product [Calypogeia fissa]